MNATKIRVVLPICRIDVARSALAMGLRSHAAELAMMAKEMIDETDEACVLADYHRVQAAIAIASDDTETAEECLTTALDVARGQGGKLWELRTALDLADLWQKQGRIDEAIDLLEPVHNSIAEGDCPKDRATAQTLLKELSS